MTGGPDAGRDDWLAWRSRGIGASDVAGILGISPWQTPYSVWQSKIGVGVSGTGGNTEALRWGHLLEDAILGECERRLAVDVSDRQLRCTHPDQPWARCTVDGLYADRAGPERGVVEVKTTGEPRWGSVPQYYEAQVQWQLEVTGLPRAWVACLHAGRRLSLWPVERDRQVGMDLLYLAGQFWQRYVLTRQPPPVDGSRATADALAQRWHASEPTLVAELDDMADEIEELRLIRADEKTLAARRAEVENRLKERLRDAEGGTVGGRLAITWKPYTSQRFELDRFRSEEPLLAGKYTIQTTARQLRLARQQQESAGSNDESAGDSSSAA